MSRFAAQPKARTPKSFSFSYSKLKNYENCPKRYYHTSIAYDVPEETSPHLVYGDKAHSALANAIEKGAPLPEDFAQWQKHVDRFRADPEKPHIKTLVEQKLAIDENFQPCEWKSSSAWFRGIVDVAKVAPRSALVADFKTGKIQEDCVQLALFSQLIFSHYPKIEAIRTQFIWLKDDVETEEKFERKEMADLWAALLPRVETLKEATENNEFPAKPTALCRWCPVTSCASHPSNGG
jgi:RecB family exonuclease